MHVEINYRDIVCTSRRPSSFSFRWLFSLASVAALSGMSLCQYPLLGTTWRSIRQNAKLPSLSYNLIS